MKSKEVVASDDIRGVLKFLAEAYRRPDVHTPLAQTTLRQVTGAALVALEANGFKPPEAAAIILGAMSEE